MCVFAMVSIKSRHFLKYILPGSHCCFITPHPCFKAVPESMLLKGKVGKNRGEPLYTMPGPLASGEANIRVSSVMKFNHVIPRILDLLIYFRIRHSFAHLRPVILSADWSISRLQSWICSSLPTVAEFVKLTQSIVIEIQRQSADLSDFAIDNFCGVHSDLRGKGIRVSPA